MKVVQGLFGAKNTHHNCFVCLSRPATLVLNVLQGGLKKDRTEVRSFEDRQACPCRVGKITARGVIHAHFLDLVECAELVLGTRRTPSSLKRVGLLRERRGGGREESARDFVWGLACSARVGLAFVGGERSNNGKSVG